MKIKSPISPYTGIKVQSDVSSHTKENRVFVEQDDGKLHIQSEKGHFYPIPKKYISPFQSELGVAFTFTQEGLDSLRGKHNAVHGVPPFLHDLLSLNVSNPHVKQIATVPHLYPYFKDEQFLVVHNTSHDPKFGSHKNPKAQKLKDEAVMLCGWFIHPQLSCLSDESRQLLEELSGDVANKPILEKLRAHYADTEGSSPVADNKPTERDSRTIGDLRKDGEYLASILDLNKSHVGLLKSLKEKALCHLKEQYNINDHDDVDLYFHFPYPDSTTTLHLHIRANQGLHPLEKAKSFTLDELIDELSSGTKIDDIILKRQSTYGDKIFRDPQRSIEEFKNLKGVTVSDNAENIHRLKKSKNQISRIYSRDDLLINNKS